MRAATKDYQTEWRLKTKGARKRFDRLVRRLKITPERLEALKAKEMRHG